MKSTRQYKNDEDIIGVREFAGRLAVLQATIKAALRVGTIERHKSSPAGTILFDFTTESRKFIAASPNPARYSPQAIARRIEMHPELAHVYKQRRMREKQEAARKNNKFANPLTGLDGGSHHKNRIGHEEPFEAEPIRSTKTPGCLQRNNDLLFDSMSISTARASRELWRAKREKFHFEQEQGTYIKTELVADDWEDIATMVRIKLLELPDRFDAQITGCIRCECGNVKVDRVRINELLTTECKQILSGIAYDAKEKAKRYAKSAKKSRSSQEAEDAGEM
jgi:hypothetical protein